MFKFFETILNENKNKSDKDYSITCTDRSILFGNKYTSYEINEKSNEIRIINDEKNFFLYFYKTYFSMSIMKNTKFFNFNTGDNYINFSLPSGIRVHLDFEKKSIGLTFNDRANVISCRYLKPFSLKSNYMNYHDLDHVNSRETTVVFKEKIPLKYRDDNNKLYVSNASDKFLALKMVNNDTYEEFYVSPKKCLYKSDNYICTNENNNLFYGLNNDKYNYGISVDLSNQKRDCFKIRNDEQIINVYEDGIVEVYNDDKLVFKLDYETLRDFVLDVKKDDVNKVTKHRFPINNQFKKDFDAEKELESLIGLKNVKNQIQRFKKYCLNAIENGNPVNLHMVFSGNPGTGKTTVARLVSQILYKYKILPKDTFVECSKETLVARYIGQTALKTLEMVDLAMGGVLFIDEAYSLNPKSDSGFEAEALATLIKAMEDNKGKFCVILAGYSNEMNELFDANSGLKSRIQKDVHFEDYNREELGQILDINLKKVNYSVSKEAKELILDYVEAKKDDHSYSNARELRTAVEQLCMIQAERTINDIDDFVISNDDVIVFLKENIENIKKASLEKCEMINYDKVIELSNLEQDILKNGVDILESVISLQVATTSSESEGSGFIISPDGYAVTCAHCVKDAYKLVARRRIKDRNGNWVDTYHNCLLAGVDYKKDVAIIKLESSRKTNYSYLPLGINKNLNPFSEVVEIGYPLGESSFDNVSVYQGYISSVQDIQGRNMFLIDVKSCPGLSGACLLDKNSSKVVGVIKGAVMRENFSFNLAIMIKDVLNLIKRKN